MRRGASNLWRVPAETVTSACCAQGRNMRTVLAVVPYLHGLRDTRQGLDLIQERLERWRRCQAQRSIRVQEGTPFVLQCPEGVDAGVCGSSP